MSTMAPSPLDEIRDRIDRLADIAEDEQALTDAMHAYGAEEVRVGRATGAL